MSNNYQMHSDATIIPIGVITSKNVYLIDPTQSYPSLPLPTYLFAHPAKSAGSCQIQSLISVLPSSKLPAGAASRDCMVCVLVATGGFIWVFPSIYLSLLLIYLSLLLIYLSIYLSPSISLSLSIYLSI